MEFTEGGINLPIIKYLLRRMREFFSRKLNGKYQAVFTMKVTVVWSVAEIYRELEDN